MQKSIQHTETRHGRLFDLIRQKHREDTTVARFDGHIIRKISVEEFEELKTLAEQSPRERN